MSLIKVNLNFNIKELGHTLIWIVGIHIADTVILRIIKTTFEIFFEVRSNV